MAEAKRVDTTGAGDFYAAGFLVGLTRGPSMVQCARSARSRQAA
ncbi:MAG: PfkB family carbohydrate kinase [Alistipes sp.]